jgi:hypothetical protein
LKQSGRMWYNQLKKFLLHKGFSNNDDFPCVFIKKSLDFVSYPCIWMILISLEIHEI